MSEKIQAMRTIADWVIPYGWKVYYNQKNSDGFSTFTSAGSGAKPDILMSKNDYNVLIEVKPGKDHVDILDGFDQTINYAGEYYSGRIKYKTNITKNINAFVLATKLSPFGYLYSNESDLPVLNYTSLKIRENMTEKPITFSVNRLLWRHWDSGLASEHFENIRRGQAQKNLVLPRKPYIGTMIAKTEAATGQITPEPYLYLNNNLFIPIGYDKIYAFEG